MPRGSQRRRRFKHTLRYMDGFTREEFWGKPIELILWLLLIFGSLAFGLWSLKRFPLRDPNDPAYVYGFIAAYGISSLLVYCFRSAVFPAHDAFNRPELRSYKAWVGLLVALMPSAAIYGVFFCLNAVLHWR